MDSNCHVEKKRTCRRDLVHLGFVVLKRVARVYNDFCLVCSVETLFSLSLCVFLSFFLIQFPLQRLRLGSTGGGYRVVPPRAYARILRDDGGEQS